MASYDQAIQFQGNFPDAWYDRGSVLEKLGRDEDAICAPRSSEAIDIKFGQFLASSSYSTTSALSVNGCTTRAIAC
ncbi:MAG: tetratricopeptide repeat protein [Brasilonema sp.]